MSNITGYMNPVLNGGYMNPIIDSDINRTFQRLNQEISKADRLVGIVYLLLFLQCEYWISIIHHHYLGIICRMTSWATLSQFENTHGLTWKDGEEISTGGLTNPKCLEIFSYIICTTPSHLHFQLMCTWPYMHNPMMMNFLSLLKRQVCIEGEKYFVYLIRHILFFIYVLTYETICAGKYLLLSIMIQLIKLERMRELEREIL